MKRFLIAWLIFLSTSFALLHLKLVTMDCTKLHGCGIRLKTFKKTWLRRMRRVSALWSLSNKGAASTVRKCTMRCFLSRGSPVISIKTSSSVQINMFGDVDVTDFDGTILPEKEMVKRWGALFTPSILFFPQDVAGDVSSCSSSGCDYARGFWGSYHLQYAQLGG